MVTKGLVKSGQYFDSVSLMIVAKEINATDKIEDSSVVMGSDENKSILENSNFLLPEFSDSDGNDLLVVVKGETEEAVDKVLGNIDTYLEALKKDTEDSVDFEPKSLDGAIKKLPNANLSLISVAGKYAAGEALKALDKNMHVMLFSDNVSIEDELMLKKVGKEKGLLVMGPDCGTAIINGVPLAFANVVRRGNIGIVGASGTGTQELTAIIHNEGAGVSQAIGTGGRDVKKDIGGIMFIEALKALNNDDNTEVILLVSKPPHESVLEEIGKCVKEINKPVISVFLGADKDQVSKYGIQQFNTLEEAARHAVIASGVKPNTEVSNNEVSKEMLAGLTKDQKFVRALYSGGTFCSEAQLIIGAELNSIYSNAPAGKAEKLSDNFKSQGHTIIDLGEDEFTVGKPHPMIDFSTRIKRLYEEASDPEVAVIMLDIVIGYGAHMDPISEIVPSIIRAKEIAKENGRALPIVCTVTGTDDDPQKLSKVSKAIKDAGAYVYGSNAQMSNVALNIIKQIG